MHQLSWGTISEKIQKKLWVLLLIKSLTEAATTQLKHWQLWAKLIPVLDSSVSSFGATGARFGISGGFKVSPRRGDEGASCTELWAKLGTLLWRELSDFFNSEENFGWILGDPFLDSDLVEVFTT